MRYYWNTLAMHETSVLSNQTANNLHASGVSGFKHVLNSNMASALELSSDSRVEDDITTCLNYHPASRNYDALM